MAKFRLTKKAVEDLTGIWNYTCENWSENQADIYYQLLIDGFNEIANDPTLGRNFYEIIDNLKGLKVGRHIVFYHLVSKQMVEIIRILHEQMDLKNRMIEK
jgi:toxin ParE1/3/4